MSWHACGLAVIVDRMQGLVPDPTVNDAFGAALRACHAVGARPGVMFEYERDDGFTGVEDAATYFAPAEDWTTVERQACEEVTGRVLDVGCGAGRHATVLTATGLHVIGVDPSPGAVEVARARGVDARLGSASALPAGITAVDTVVLFGHNLGLLGTPRQAPTVLAELARVATSHARVFASGVDPYATADPVHSAYHDRNRQRGRMPGHLRLRVRHEHLVSEWFDYLFLSELELANLLRNSPWRLVEVRCGDYGKYVAVMELR
jgi:SAM-dependent methyltransferase